MRNLGNLDRSGRLVFLEESFGGWKLEWGLVAESFSGITLGFFAIRSEKKDTSCRRLR